LVDHVHDFVGPRVDDADFVVDDEIAVVAIVGEETDDFNRDREEAYVARNAVTDMKIEGGVAYPGALKIERTMQPLTIFHAQVGARFANILTPLSDAFAALVSAFFGAPALLHTLLALSRALTLGIALLRALTIRTGSFLLGGAALFGRALIALALFTLGRPLAFLIDLALRLSPTIGFVLTSRALYAVAVLRLIAAWSTELSTRAARTWGRVDARPAASGRTVHAGLAAASWTPAAMFMSLS
jgi:hypothetical protein